MDYKKWDGEAIPEYALQPAKPLEPETEEEVVQQTESFDVSAYDRLFSEMARLKKSFEAEVKAGNAAIEEQERAVSRQLEEWEAGNADIEADAEIRPANEPVEAIAPEEEEKAEPAVSADPEKESAEQKPDQKPAILTATPSAESKQEGNADAVSEKSREDDTSALVEKTVQPVRIYPAGEDMVQSELSFTDVQILPGAQIHMEEDLLVPDTKPDLSIIRMVEGRCKLAETEFPGGNERHGEIRVSGDLQLQVLYSPSGEPGKLMALSAEIPFRGDVSASMKTGGKICVDAHITKLEWEVMNERKYRIRADIGLDLRGYGEVSLELFHSVKGEGIQVRKETIPLTEVCMRKRSHMELDEIMQKAEGRCQIGEILCWTASAAEMHRQITEDKVVINGVVRCSVLYQNQENGEGDGKPEYYKGKIEFTQFVPLGMEGESRNAAGSRVALSLKNPRLTVEEDDAGTRNRFRFLAELESDVELYREEFVEAVTDLYDPRREVCYDTMEVPVYQWKGSGFTETGIREIVTVPEQNGGAEQVLYLTGTPQIQKLETEQGKGVAEGVIDVALLCVSETEKTPFPLRQQIPFRCSVNLPDAEPGMRMDGSVVLKDLWFDRVSGRQIEVSGSLSVSAMVVAERSCPVIRNLALIDRMEKETRPSVIVYVTGGGESLWNIAKRFRTPVDAVRDVNGLSEKEAVPSGTKLLIVK